MVSMVFLPIWKVYLFSTDGNTVQTVRPCKAPANEGFRWSSLQEAVAEPTNSFMSAILTQLNTGKTQLTHLTLIL